MENCKVHIRTFHLTSQRPNHSTGCLSTSKGFPINLRTLIVGENLRGRNLTLNAARNLKGGNCWSSLDRASEQYDRRSSVEGRIEWGKAVWRAENESRVISNYSARRLVGTSQLLNRQGSTNRLEPDLCSYYLGHILFSVHN